MLTIKNQTNHPVVVFDYRTGKDLEISGTPVTIKGDIDVIKLFEYEPVPDIIRKQDLEVPVEKSVTLVLTNESGFDEVLYGEEYPTVVDGEITVEVGKRDRFSAKFDPSYISGREYNKWEWERQNRDNLRVHDLTEGRNRLNTWDDILC